MTVDPGLFEENERMMGANDRPQIFCAGAFDCELGGHLPSVEVAYRAWGALNAEQSNAILVCHAISGDWNAAAWWSRLVGPGKAIDTDRYFVVCANVLGGCQGTTGPASLDPNGKRWGSRFPAVTIGDMVALQDRLRAELGVDQWELVCGGSMGGMQALEWGRSRPDRVKKVWATASALAHSPMQIGFNEVARQAILRDPKWQGGDYDPSDPPANGLALARMMGHLTYLSPEAFEAKFARNLQDGRMAVQPTGAQFVDKPVFEVENYLSYQGNKFTERFDANTLLVVSNALDRYRCDGLSPGPKYLFTSFTSDWLYPSSQSQAAHEAALAASCASHWLDIPSPLGHDAFLLDDAAQANAVREFLN